MKTVHHLIDGKRRESDRTFVTVDPATEEVLAEVAVAGADEVDAAVDAAWRAYRDGWRSVPPSGRAELLRRLADRIEERLDEIADVESRDAGKPLFDARGDVEEAAGILRYYATLPENLRGVTFPEDPGYLTTSSRVPYGVVAAVAPWNFPFYFAVVKTAPALACGNAVVFKSAEQTPLSTEIFADLCLEAGFPPGVVNTVFGGPETGQLLTSHPDVPAITFTGSTETGSRILEAAAARVAQTHVELGGKSPYVVLADADVERAAEAAVLAAFGNAGQVCTAASRLLVAEPVLDEFTELVVAGAGRLCVGDPSREDVEVGPLISGEHRDRVQRYVDDARRDGARVLVGGGPPDGHDGTGYYLAPTVLDGVSSDMAIARDEVFGPVTAIIPVADEAEAVAVANDTAYGLSAVVWTDSADQALRVSEQLEAGVISINTPLRNPARVPYEGHKRSGGGEDMGLEAISTFTQLRVTCLRFA